MNHTSVARKPRARHLYSVFTHSPGDSTKLYFGSSEARALRAFAYAIVRNPQASSVELRRDLKPWLRVAIVTPAQHINA